MPLIVIDSIGPTQTVGDFGVDDPLVIQQSKGRLNIEDYDDEYWDWPEEEFELETGTSYYEIVGDG